MGKKIALIIMNQDGSEQVTFDFLIDQSLGHLSLEEELAIWWREYECRNIGNNSAELRRPLSRNNHPGNATNSEYHRYNKYRSYSYVKV